MYFLSQGGDKGGAPMRLCSIKKTDGGYGGES